MMIIINKLKSNQPLILLSTLNLFYDVLLLIRSKAFQCSLANARLLNSPFPSALLSSCALRTQLETSFMQSSLQC